MWSLSILPESFERCFIVLKGQQLLAPLSYSPSPLGILWWKLLCWKTLLLFFRFRLLVFILKCLTVCKPLWCFLRKSKRPPCPAYFVHMGFTCRLDCLACRRDARSLVSWQDETEKFIYMYKNPHRTLPFGVFGLKASSYYSKETSKITLENPLKWKKHCRHWKTSLTCHMGGPCWNVSTDAFCLAGIVVFLFFNLCD